MIGHIKYLWIAICVAFLMMLLLAPSLIYAYWRSRNVAIFWTECYWVAVGGSVLPWLLGFIAFCIIYPLTGAPGEGGIAGIWFVFLGMLMGIDAYRPYFLVTSPTPQMHHL